ncbi:MAG: hypothetical protein AB1295_05935 [Candidatus Micrarchaeota archaeon]
MAALQNPPGKTVDRLDQRVLSLCEAWAHGFPNDPGCMWASGCGFDWGLRVNAASELGVHGSSTEEVLKGICEKVVDELDPKTASGTLRIMLAFLDHRPGLKVIVTDAFTRISTNQEYLSSKSADEGLTHRPFAKLAGLLPSE